MFNSSLFISGPLGNIAASYGSRGNSRANSRTGSKENLCEDCVQNPLDLVDASIQVIRTSEINNFPKLCCSGFCIPSNVFVHVKPKLRHVLCYNVLVKYYCYYCIFEHIVFHRDLQEFTTDKLLMERQIVLIVHLSRYKLTSKLKVLVRNYALNNIGHAT